MRKFSAFEWVPDFARGHVKEMRVRWALEEAGLPYREMRLTQEEKAGAPYLQLQPFGQVPCFEDGEVSMFESGAIVLRIAEQSEALMPRDAQGRARTMSWVFAALNSVEPEVAHLAAIDLFHEGEEWARLRRPGAVENVLHRLRQLAGWLGDRDYLEDRFTAGDLMMTTVLREVRQEEVLVQFPTLRAYRERCEARPAFRQALADHLAIYAQAAE
ncbi:glutathione S-transferase family protein [Parvibaculum sp.]|uniref:glutathione S-transferase family protein n=1 Tax=Parvibaculum sp. TaxID=2024848 RepID=UPI001B1459FF|nr:glutathione S-transferase family protein [Parvibaculum sp.]MBO6667206.1 glutathione S-transferase family protein [Parvibaculum sp.]MBO6690801.1 glutathione S-transferase family protein [Parvibaculum sp.]MBO6713759.1 glutathione S-transferase family protein [Parvibaculum sp.]